MLPGVMSGVQICCSHLLSTHRSRKPKLTRFGIVGKSRVPAFAPRAIPSRGSRLPTATFAHPPDICWLFFVCVCGLVSFAKSDSPAIILQLKELFARHRPESVAGGRRQVMQTAASMRPRSSISAQDYCFHVYSLVDILACTRVTME